MRFFILTSFLYTFLVSFGSIGQNYEKSYSKSHRIVQAVQNGIFVPNQLVIKYKSPSKTLTTLLSAQQKKVWQIEKETALLPHSPTSSPSIHEQNLAQLKILSTFSSKYLNDIIQYLYTHNLVEYIEPLPYAVSTDTPYNPNDPSFRSQWGLFKSKLPEAWGITKGSSNVVVGIVDSGVLTTHPDLRNNFYYNEIERRGLRGVDDDNNGYVDDSLGYDFGDRDADVTDAFYHGTNMAGVIAATPDNKIGITGVGFNARIMPLKVMNQFFKQPASAIYEAMLYGGNQGCKVLNLSISFRDANDREAGYLQSQQDLINYLVYEKDVLIVAAAGNNILSNSQGREADTYPAAYQNVLSVAATDLNDDAFILSLYSKYTDLAAPGVNILTTHTPAAYDQHTGSSLSAAFVSGAAALLKAHFPSLKALQIGELLRVTTDNIYQRPNNTLLRERLGTGRLNVLNAIQQRNTAQSVRLQRVTFQNQWGQYAFAGDTIQLVGTFVNWLNPTNSSLSVELSTVSPTNVKVVQSTFQIGSLNSLDSTRNQGQKAFRVYLPPNLPPNSVVTFRLGYTDNKGYTDYQYFWIQTSDDLLTLNQNNMAISASSNGRLGFVDENNAKGVGITSNGLPLIKEGGLLIGLNSQQVANGVLSAPNRKHNHFKSLQTIRFANKTLQTLSITSSFSDSLAENRQIGVNITQELTQRINKPHRDYTIATYTITNRTNQTIDSLSVGLYVDWDINNPKNNKADWDVSQQFGYVYDGVKYAGVKALGTQLLYYALDREATNGLNIKDSFSIAEKWFTLNNGIRQRQAGYVLNGVGSDVAHVVGAKIMNLKAGEARTLQFIIAAGNSYQDLYETMFLATAYATGNAPKSPLPTIKTTLCTEDLTIRPQNGSTFNFYTSDNLVEPLKTSNILRVNVADTVNTYYISNVDSLIESSLVKYQFTVRSATAMIQAVDSINLFEKQTIQFYGIANKGQTYEWNFGDGKKSSMQNPLHNYTLKGNYIVSLQVTDSLGCKITLAKTIKVVYLPRSPQPIIPPFFQICSKTPVVIAPSNGKKFKFYANEQLTQLLQTGQSFSVKDIKIKQLYITNIDSALESYPSKVTINRTVLDADFTTQPQADTILFTSVVFFDKSIGENTIRRWSWNFGDGTLSEGRNVSHRFSKKGVYKVSLTVTDETGCSDVITKDFKVGNRSPYPIVPSTVLLCTPANYSLTPQNGSKFEFFKDADLHQKIGSGKTLTTFIEQSQFVYVVCVDSIVESAAAKVDFLVQQATVNIDLPPALKLFETNKITLQAQTNVPVVQYLWEFGNNSISTSPMPTQIFTRQGIYPIKLTITDNLGCKTTVYKELKVVNRAKSPLVAAYTTCEGENITIRPQGGTMFNFYTSPNGTPIASGSSYTVNLRNPLDLYITCTDSMAESLPTYTRIEISKVKAEFTVNLDTLNLYEKDSLVITVTQPQADVIYEWNINSTIYKGQKIAVLLPKEGLYTVALKATDKNTCSVTSYKNVVVQYENTSSLPPYKKLIVYPNPTRDEAKVELELRKIQEVSYQLYNTAGQLLQQIEKEYIKEKLYRLDCSHLPQGTYLLQINIGNKIEIRKIIVY